ncbi:MAG TPA: hypothetical protein PKA62_07485, partial [Thermoanaerobaculia bacterium]|nr:hypothetical protein [Thermoanaerobaculia bacterium]
MDGDRKAAHRDLRAAGPLEERAGDRRGEDEDLGDSGRVADGGARGEPAELGRTAVAEDLRRRLPEAGEDERDAAAAG